MSRTGKILCASALSLSLAAAMAIPAFADTASTTPGTPVVSPTTQNAIKCIAGAVAVRESALDAAYASSSAAINGAYAKRASDLATAYTLNPGNSAIKNAIKAAWTAFSTAAKAARKQFTSSQKTAWANFKSMAKACKAPASVSDSANMSADTAGN